MSQSALPVDPVELDPAPAPVASGATRPRRKRRGFLFWASVGWLVLLCGCALLAPWLPGLPSYTSQIGGIADKPSWSLGGLFGTDGVGRSTMSLVVYGARASLTIAVLATAAALAIGVVLGLVSGYYGGVADAGGTMFANSVAALPPLLLLLALVTAIGPSVTGITIALGVLLSEFYLRIARGAVIATSSREYILTARAMGATDRRIILREILPNIMFQPGNPCDYHYHDGDEYWVVFRGHFDIDYHGLKVPTEPGQLLAFGKGYEHGLLDPTEAMNAIVLAMPLEDRQRDGHLNRERNGDPVPGRDIPESVWDGLREQAAEPSTVA